MSFSLLRVINTQPVGLHLELLIDNGLMNSPDLGDELIYQKVNLVEKKIYPLLALAFGRLILTVRIHFLNSGLTLNLLFYTHLISLVTP